MSALNSKGRGGCPVQLRLNNIENTRKSLARVIRARMAYRLSEGDYRSAVYGMSTLLGFFKTEDEQTTQRLLSEIRAMIDERSQGPKN